MADTPDAIAKRWFDEVWNNGDEAAIDRMMHPHGIVHGLGPAPLNGPDQFKPFYRLFHRALGEMKIDITQSVVQGDMCAVHCRVVARHVGPDLGGPATGRSVDFHGITMLRVKDGLIVEGWNCFDFLTLYQQLGWVGNPVLPR
jgi:predicted ester cyclase